MSDSEQTVLSYNFRKHTCTVPHCLIE